MTSEVKGAERERKRERERESINRDFYQDNFENCGEMKRLKECALALTFRMPFIFHMHLPHEKTFIHDTIFVTI